MDQKLHITLLGDFHLSWDGTQPIPLASRKAEAALAYLVCQARPIARESLAAIFWDDSLPEQALANLRKLLSELRRAVGDYLLIERQTVSFDMRGDYWLDTAVFQQLLQPSPQRLPFSQIETAVALYHNDFLAHLQLPDSQDFNAWASLERERLRQQAAAALHQAIAHCLRGRHYLPGIAYANRLLQITPLAESGRRQLMLLLARAGRPQEALAHYAQFRRQLAAELGVEPTHQTEDLARRIETAGQHAPHLPLTSDAFIGREAELRQISQQLADPACRLLTLIGPGGVGKTRLAVEATHEAALDYLHGVYFAAFSDISSPLEVATRLMTAVNAPLSPGAPPDAQLLDFLRQKETLLTLDNCETLLADQAEGVKLLARILAEAPQVKILATSRERFNLAAEQAVELRGIPTTPATTLFADRARRAAPDFNLTDQNLPAVAQICQLVDGFPLGIELAAAAVSRLPVAEIAAQIARTLDFLTAAQPDLPAKHHSLRAVFEHSWQTLLPDEQETHQKLSVFRGEFDGQAARVVADAQPHTLLALVDKSMLRLTRNGRYQLHILLREYAAAKLNQTADNAQETFARHAAHYIALLAAQERLVTGPHVGQAVRIMADNIENIRHAWRWSVSVGDQAAIGKGINALHAFYATNCAFLEGEELLEMAAAAVAALPPTRENQTLLGNIWARQGKLLEVTSHSERATELLQKSLALLRGVGAEDETGLALHGLGYLAHSKGRNEEARDYLRQALAVYGRTEQLAPMAACLNILGLVARRQGAYEEARRYCEESLSIRRRIGDQRGIASTLNSLGLTLCDLTEYDLARDYLQESLAIAQELNFPIAISNALTNLSHCSYFTGDKAAALGYIHQGKIVYEQIGDRWGVAIAYNNLGYIARDDGLLAEAKSYYLQSVAIYREIGVKSGLTVALGSLADCCLSLNETAEATDYLCEALELALMTGDEPNTLDSLITVARLLARHGRDRESLAWLHFVHNHPKVKANVKKRASAYLAELGAGVGAAVMGQAAADALNLTIDPELCQQLMDQLKG